MLSMLTADKSKHAQVCRLPLPVGEGGCEPHVHVIHYCLGPNDFTSQMACISVQKLLQGTWTCLQTDKCNANSSLHLTLHREAEKGTNFLLCASFNTLKKLVNFFVNILRNI